MCLIVAGILTIGASVAPACVHLDFIDVQRKKVSVRERRLSVQEKARRSGYSIGNAD